MAGYCIDFRFKADTPSRPAHFGEPGQEDVYVRLVQYGLGCYERYLADEGEQWLQAAISVGDELVESQTSGGTRHGGWEHRFSFPHTFHLSAPWLSSIAQGEGASLLTRLHLATEDERYAEAAVRALAPLCKHTSEGGVRAELNGGPVYEEYPTDPPSFVLNGAIFALWGCYDVNVAFDDPAASKLFGDGIESLSANLHLYDTGYWSLYDLYPHPTTNVASSAYHSLHINQLLATQQLSPDPRIESTLNRFKHYAASRWCFARAFSRKVLFRLAVPRKAPPKRVRPISED